MKKILLCITLLISLFIPSIKADSYNDWPYMYISADIVQGQQSYEAFMRIFIEPQYNGFVYYDFAEHKIFNKSDDIITGMADLNGVPLFVSCNSESYEWEAHYGQTMEDPVIATATYATVLETGNEFEWWSQPSQIDLTITESCLLIILFICATNLICGKE